MTVDRLCPLCVAPQYMGQRVLRAFCVCVWEQDTVVGWWVKHVHTDPFHIAVGHRAQLIDDESE